MPYVNNQGIRIYGRPQGFPENPWGLSAPKSAAANAVRLWCVAAAPGWVESGRCGSWDGGMRKGRQHGQ